MNEGHRAAFGSVSASHQPLLAVTSRYLEGWNGNDNGGTASVCSKTKSPPTCTHRDSENAYSLASSNAVCQCDDLCSKFQDCCQNLNTSAAATTVSSFAATAADKVRPEDHDAMNTVRCLSTQYPRDHYRGIGFYMISTCSTSFNDVAVAAKCQRSDGTEHQSLFSAIPVEKNGRVYRNAFCALCHHETVSAEDFWLVNFQGPRNHSACDEALRHFFGNASDAIFEAEKEDPCRLVRAMAYPRTNALSGETRMGKLCLFQADGSEDQKEARIDDSAETDAHHEDHATMGQNQVIWRHQKFTFP